MTLLEKILRRQHSTNKCNTPSFKSYLSSSRWIFLTTRRFCESRKFWLKIFCFFFYRNDEGRFVLEKNDVRLVIFKDHDRFGRKLLYDSLRCEGKVNLILLLYFFKFHLAQHSAIFSQTNLNHLDHYLAIVYLYTLLILLNLHPLHASWLRGLRSKDQLNINTNMQRIF